MKLGILTQYYPPEIGAPQARLSQLARAFRAHGHEVHILTAFPNYPTGKIYPGYHGFARTEFYDGSPVYRSWIYPTKSVGLVRRLACYWSFTCSSAVVGAWRLPPCDYLLTESPPLFLGLTGWLLAALKHARWIFNVADLWPSSAVQLGVLGQGIPLRIAEALERFCYRNAWLVTGQSREILEQVRARHAGARTYLLSNGADPAFFTEEGRGPEPASRTSNPGEIKIVYAGLHGIAQGLDIVLKAAARLQAFPSLRFVLAGDGPEKEALKAEAARLSLKNVKFLDPQPRHSIPALLRAADIVLVPLKRTIDGAVPSKLYEAMAAGVPVVLASGGESADIVRRTRCGLTAKPGDADSLCGCIQRLACDADLRAKLGSNGRKAASDQFNRDLIAAKFIEFLSECQVSKGQ
jgi:glycosyltransferase involved in cell wall biosynthesis